MEERHRQGKLTLLAEAQRASVKAEAALELAERLDDEARVALERVKDADPDCQAPDCPPEYRQHDSLNACPWCEFDPTLHPMPGPDAEARWEAIVAELAP